MRIAIDARLLEVQDIGSSVYLRSLLRAFARGEDEHEYLLICRSAAAAALPLEARFRWVESPDAALLSERWEQLALPGLVAALRPDVFFGASSVLPAVKTCPQVTIIHDVGFEDEPGFYASTLRGYLGRWVRAAAGQSDCVLTLSEHSRASICRVYKLLPGRVRVTPLAPDEIFEPVPDGDERSQLLTHYGIHAPYLLSVAALEPNKNLIALLRAYRSGGGALGLGRQFVLVGGGSGQAQLRQLISRLQLSEDVLLTGHVPRAHLPGLYSGADCFLWASRYEGFGLPPLEAMACGTPVISSNCAAMPEVLGDAAVLCDPTRPDEFAGALERVLADAEMQQDLRHKGLVRAASFSWRRTADATLEALASAAEGTTA